MLNVSPLVESLFALLGDLGHIGQLQECAGCRLWTVSKRCCVSWIVPDSITLEVPYPRLRIENRYTSVECHTYRKRITKLLSIQGFSMSAPPRVLLLGGHGKVSQFLTPILLTRSWQLTSVIRDPAQKPTITALGASYPGQIEVLISSLENVKTQAQAQSIIASAEPNYIVWSAGAGGKGGPERTSAIDRDACIAFVRAAAATESVSKFLLVSYLGSRRSKAPWWSDEEWKATQEINNGALKYYYKAKLAADECLTAVGKARGEGFAAICLRPGTLADGDETGKVSLGETEATGRVKRSDVARVAADVLDKVCKSCWLDLLEGEESVEGAVERCVSGGIDCVEGEDVEGMVKQWSS